MFRFFLCGLQLLGVFYVFPEVLKPSIIERKSALIRRSLSRADRPNPVRGGHE